MLDWILQNKEWIFSGIGVTVIGVTGWVFKFLINKRKKATTNQKKYISNKFWSNLSGTVVIIFGNELPDTEKSGKRPRVSLNDLEASRIISNYLSPAIPAHQKIVV